VPSTHRFALLVALVVAVIAAAPVASLAGPHGHPPVAGGSPDARAALAHGLPIVLTAMMLGMLALVGGRRRWTRRVVLALIALLAVFAVETAVHSIHHMGDRGAAQACAIQAACQQASAVCADTSSVPGLAWIVYLRPVIDADVLSSVSWFRPDEGRAPPLAPAA
jgi:hypothetical protein